MFILQNKISSFFIFFSQFQIALLQSILLIRFCDLIYSCAFTPALPSSLISVTVFSFCLMFIFFLRTLYNFKIFCYFFLRNLILFQVVYTHLKEIHFSPVTLKKFLAMCLLIIWLYCSSMYLSVQVLSIMVFACPILLFVSPTVCMYICIGSI